MAKFILLGHMWPVGGVSCSGRSSLLNKDKWTTIDDEKRKNDQNNHFSLYFTYLHHTELKTSVLDWIHLKKKCSKIATEVFQTSESDLLKCFCVSSSEIPQKLLRQLNRRGEHHSVTDFVNMVKWCPWKDLPPNIGIFFLIK